VFAYRAAPATEDGDLRCYDCPVPFLDAKSVLDLPLDRLALEVLKSLQSDWNVGNWMGTHGLERGPASEAVAEAVQWLYSNGMIARNWSQTATEAFITTRQGRRFLAEGYPPIAATQRLALDLHPALEKEVRSLYLSGRWDLAAFAAMKLVEVRVRRMAGAPEALIGTKLMQQAFGTEGPLRSPEMEAGEQVARMELFKGAIGAFKNPTSHREVDFDDPTEAAEVVLLGDLLLRILDRIAAEPEEKNAL
jgi:uncharacterized protein (TIGR02391 family)